MPELTESAIARRLARRKRLTGFMILHKAQYMNDISVE
jgi:hypothetical protein